MKNESYIQTTCIIQMKMNMIQVCGKFVCMWTLTVDAASFVAVIRTVVNFITLFGAVDAGSVAALELVRSTRKEGWGTQTTHTHTLELADLLHYYYYSENDIDWSDL